MGPEQCIGLLQAFRPTHAIMQDDTRTFGKRLSRQPHAFSVVLYILFSYPLAPYRSSYPVRDTFIQSLGTVKRGAAGQKHLI